MFGVFRFVAGRPTNVLDLVSPKFEGYNGYGTVNYDSDIVSKKIKIILLTKNGIGQSDAEAIVNGRIPSKFFTDVDERNKLEDTKTQLDSIGISFSKKSNLSNGDQVKLTVKAANDLPIKGGTKVLKVSGLKRTSTYTINDAMGNSTPTFTGTDGFGEIKTNKKMNTRFTFDHDKTLKNGDQVKFKLSSSYQNDQLAKGRVLTGRKYLQYKVTGLTPLASIADWKALEVLDLENAKSDYKTSEVEPIATYLSIANGYGLKFIITDDNPYENVPKSAKYVSFATIMKITQSLGGNEPIVTYKEYGYRDVPYFDGKVHTEKMDQLKYSGLDGKSISDAVLNFKFAHDNVQKLE